MKWVTHMPALAAFTFSQASECVLISIRDVPEANRPMHLPWRAALCLAFHDVSDREEKWKNAGYVAPNATHAKAIAEFVRAHWDENVAVHCEAGISRSAAVAEVLRRLGWALRHPDANSTERANPLLFGLLERELKV